MHLEGENLMVVFSLPSPFSKRAPVLKTALRQYLREMPLSNDPFIQYHQDTTLGLHCNKVHSQGGAHMPKNSSLLYLRNMILWTQEETQL